MILQGELGKIQCSGVPFVFWIPVQDLWSSILSWIFTNFPLKTTCLHHAPSSWVFRLLWSSSNRAQERFFFGSQVLGVLQNKSKGDLNDETSRKEGKHFVSWILHFVDNSAQLDAVSVPLYLFQAGEPLQRAPFPNPKKLYLLAPSSTSNQNTRTT